MKANEIAVLLALVREGWRIQSIHYVNRAWKLSRFAGEVTFVRIPTHWTLP